MITLYDYELSAECYQARLMLSILGLQHDCVDVEFYPSREHESEWFTELSPLHRLPVLQDGATTLHDAQAILVYLAAQHDASGRWYPTGDATLLAEITQWLGFARAFAASAGAARLHETFFQPADIEAARAQAHQMLRVLDDHLWFGEYEARSWLCNADQPTIADIALFPDTALSEEGGIPRMDYPAVRRWTDRVKRINGFITMSGIFPAGPAQAESCTA